nr:MAG TPA: hypothetical protein [Caudoviricetes sp.]
MTVIQEASEVIRKFSKDYTRPVIFMVFPGMANKRFENYLKENLSLLFEDKLKTDNTEIKTDYLCLLGMCNQKFFFESIRDRIDHEYNKHDLLVVDYDPNFLQVLLDGNKYSIVLVVPSELGNPDYMYKEYMDELKEADDKMGDIISLATNENYRSWLNSVIDSIFKIRKSSQADRFEVIHLDPDFNFKRVGFEK